MLQEKNISRIEILPDLVKMRMFPGMHGQGTVELSKNDMRMVEEALKAKGYSPGKIDGVAKLTMMYEQGLCHVNPLQMHKFIQS